MPPTNEEHLNDRLDQCSSWKCALAFQCEGLRNNHTSPKTKKKNLIYWPICIEHESNVMSRYIEEVHAKD